MCDVKNEGNHTYGEVINEVANDANISIAEATTIVQSAEKHFCPN